MKPRQSAKVTRLDLRIPNDIYDRVEAIARANHAPTHHITEKIVLSPTVIKLLEVGIRSIADNYQSLTDSDHHTRYLSDTLTPKFEAIESELTELKRQMAEILSGANAQLNIESEANLAIEIQSMEVSITDNIDNICKQELVESTEPIIENIQPQTESDAEEKLAAVRALLAKYTAKRESNLPVKVGTVLWKLKQIFDPEGAAADTAAKTAQYEAMKIEIAAQRVAAEQAAIDKAAAKAAAKAARKAAAQGTVDSEQLTVDGEQSLEVSSDREIMPTAAEIEVEQVIEAAATLY
jgi:hypothetical protein